MPTNRAKYPDHNDTTLEEEMFKRLAQVSDKIKSKYSYLPIFWTTYFVRNYFASDPVAMRRLTEFVDRIKEPWFTISQYDDGIVMGDKIKTEHISMSAGGYGDVWLPLTCNPRHEDTVRLPTKYKASFVGSFQTYKWRTGFAEKLKSVEGFFIHDSSAGGPDIFEKTMLESEFALCPRGYGRTSFRLYEAMQMGTIPIYISDHHILPFEKYIDWGEFCVLVSMDDVEKIPSMISVLSEGPIRKMSYTCRQVWKEYFSYEACAKMIIKILEE